MACPSAKLTWRMRQQLVHAFGSDNALLRGLRITKHGTASPSWSGNAEALSDHAALQLDVERRVPVCALWQYMDFTLDVGVDGQVRVALVINDFDNLLRTFQPEIIDLT